MTITVKVFIYPFNKYASETYSTNTFFLFYIERINDHGD